MSKFRVTIVGGGTAGWVSALYINQRFPEADITLIESESIGILGAGEGTTPAFTGLLELLKIPLSRLIQETSTTIKNGIKFTNWTRDGSHYYHGFLAQDSVALKAFDNSLIIGDSSVLTMHAIAAKKDFSEINYAEAISEAGKVPFHIHPEYTNQLIPNPIEKYLNSANFSIHFDAVALADFFKKVATEERGITRIEGKVVSHTQHSNGNLQSVVLETDEEIFGDFFVDCTGFAKKFIGGVYESEWVGHDDYLTVDSAMPFFLPADLNIPAYTEAIAMDYGWVWKIPLQHRYGCGYVFDSNHLTDEQAKQEIVEYLGFEPEWPRESSLKFAPGYYKTPWVNNCLAVGLSSGFIEPLEATSIWASTIYLKKAFNDLRFIKKPDQSYIKKFNKEAVKINKNIFNFVYFHYMGGRTDTEFWKHYQKLDKAPIEIKKTIKRWENTAPGYGEYQEDLFPLESWLSVAAGLDKLNKKVIVDTVEDNEFPAYLENYYEQFKEVVESYVEHSKNHSDFLEDMKTAQQVTPL